MAFPAVVERSVVTGGSRLVAVPVPMYGPALALLGLGLVVRTTWPDMRHPPVAALLAACGVAAMTGALAVHLAKACLARAAFVADLRDPAVAPFFGQIGIALALLVETGLATGPIANPVLGSTVNPVLGSTVNPVLDPTDLLLRSATGAAVLLATVHAVWLLARYRPGWRSASPAWLLPGLQWLYLALLIDHAAVRIAAFVLGALAALVATGCLAARLLHGPPLPPPARPGLAVFLAVPSLVLLFLRDAAPAWVVPMAAVVVVVGLAVLLSMAVAARRPFGIAWWAWGMPVSAAALALHASAWAGGAIVASCLSTLVTAMLVVRGTRAAVAFCRAGATSAPPAASRSRRWQRPRNRRPAKAR